MGVNLLSYQISPNGSNKSESNLDPTHAKYQILTVGLTHLFDSNLKCSNLNSDLTRLITSVDLYFEHGMSQISVTSFELHAPIRRGDNSIRRDLR